MHTEGFDDALGASYRLQERLGQGATGEVWRAVDRRTDEVVAAKLLRREHASDQDLVGRFVRERSILTGLRHPSVVAVRDLVVEGDRLAIIMDLVDGGSLRDVLRVDGPLPPARAVEVVAAVLEGLAVAHSRGVLHRDIKPDNVLLTRDWQSLDEGTVKLTDFGISRMVAEGAGTTTGLLGTPEYMAPEMLVTGRCDLSADVYGVGILLYELLAGRTPFAGPGTDYTVAHRHVVSLPPALPLPDALVAELDRLLDKNPAARPTAGEAAAALRRLSPTLVDLPALAPQVPPEDFDTARGPVTMVRGMVPDVAPAPVVPADTEEPDRPRDLDLGTPDQGTLLRPMTAPRPAREEAPTSGQRVVHKKRRPAWRDPRALALVAASVVLLGGAVAYATTTGDTPTDDGPTTPSTPTVVEAENTDPTTLTGLTVTREASYDAETETVELTLTYAAQNAPLGGPFLEVVPGTDGSSCPTITWEGVQQKPNLRETSGVDVDCGWSVEPGPVPAQGSVTVTGLVPLSLEGEDPTSALQDWLDSAQASTQSAITDAQVTEPSYPVQRLQGIQVIAPSRPVSGTPLKLTVLPVWASGPDALNPLYRSPSFGEPSSMLTAIAGGEEGVRFSDGCAGALAVTGGGLEVAAVDVAAECTVIASIGNLPDTPSNTFEIVTRGS